MSDATATSVARPVVLAPLVALYRLLLRTIATRARLAGFGVLGILGILVGWQVAANGTGEPVRAAARLVDVFGLTFLIPVAALVFGTSSLGDPTDDGTLVYLWLRPVPRSSIVGSAYLAALTFVFPLAVAPVVIASALVSGDRSAIAGAALGAGLAGAAYTAVFVLLGLVTSRSLVWGVGYLLIFESFIARGGRSLGAVSIHAQSVSVLAGLAGRKLSLAYFGAVTGVIVCVVVTVAALGATVWRLRRADIA